MILMSSYLLKMVQLSHRKHVFWYLDDDNVTFKNQSHEEAVFSPED